MIPGRLRNNSPVIRGVAKSQAHVEVEYNGYIIYAKTVDAGIFEFDDLPDVGSEGTYKVTVYESDGTKNIIMIPFIQAPLSLKKGFQHIQSILVVTEVILLKKSGLRYLMLVIRMASMSMSRFLLACSFPIFMKLTQRD